jgi:Glycosyl hydrolase family 20, catalytic domain
MASNFAVRNSAEGLEPVQCAQVSDVHSLRLKAAGCVAVALALGCHVFGAPRGGAGNGWATDWRAANPVWRGVHMSVQSEDQANALLESLPKLAAVGVNVVIAEVDYSFDFQSHSEVRAAQFVTRAQAGQMAAAAHAQGIRLIPQINCLGHQSWSSNTLTLLARHPEFDETPGQYPDNKGIYCRSWCPQNPDVNPFVFALIDELIDSFDADAFHVGMDEVFIIGSEYCPRCKGGDPAKLFAKAVNDLHEHIVGQRKKEMLMWADRLLDAKALGYSEWEASKNGTYAAADLVAKDVVLCDWHYEKSSDYPSVRYLLDKGFRVWPSGWQPLEATKAFSTFALTQKPRVQGYLCTTWGKAKIRNAADWPPLKDVLRDWR